MASISVSLPVPVSDGVGAFVDCSGLSPERTINFDHGAFSGNLFLEGTNDAGASVFPIAVGPFTGQNGAPAPQNLLATVQQMRVRRTASTAGAPGTPTVTISASPSASNVFADVPVTAADGTGTGVDVSAGGDVNTIGIQGPFSGQIIIEVSTDGGATFVGSILFGVPSQTTQGSPAATNLATGAISQVRARRFGSLPGGPAPAISVGSGTTAAAGGGLVFSVTTDNQRVTTKPITGNVVVSQTGTADWALNATGFFAVDGVNGNDASAGFSTVSAAAAGAVAKKTLTAISEIIPPDGAGRVAALYIANGGLNTSQTYAEAAPFLAQLQGYANFTVLATGTQPNAGAVAFDGSANTQIYAGGITVPGLSATGYNPTAGATTTTIPCQINGGGAPALPAEPAAPLGWRVRFDIATVTAALRGICKALVAVPNSAQVNVLTALPAVPAAGDVFYIEKAGVIFTNASMGVGCSDTEALPIVGIDFQTTVFLYEGVPGFMFCGCNGLVGARVGALLTTNRILGLAQAGAAIANRGVGGNLRNAGTYFNGNAGTSVQLQIITQVGIMELLTMGGANGIFDGSVFAGGLVVQGAFGDTNWNDKSTSLGGITTPVRFIAAGTNVGFTCGLQLRGTRIQLGANDFQNMGAHPAIQLIGTCDVVFSGANTGSTGNTDVGMDLTSSRGSRIQLTSTPAVTGTAGDVRLAGGQIVTWASLQATGIVDSAGNQIIPQSPNAAISSVKFSGSLNTQNGTATSSYLADTGDQNSLEGSQSALRYPTSMRLFTRLRVTSRSDGAGVAVSATLRKNDVATTMTVSIPAGTAANTKFVDLAHPVLFVDGDDYDVRLDAASDAAPGSIFVSASLEGPC